MSQIERSYKHLKPHATEDRQSRPQSTSKPSTSRYYENVLSQIKGRDSSAESEDHELYKDSMLEDDLEAEALFSPSTDNHDQKSPTNSEQPLKKIKIASQPKPSQPKPVPLAWESISSPPTVNSLVLAKEARGEFNLPQNVREKHVDAFKKGLTPFKAFQLFFPDAYWENITLQTTNYFVEQITPHITKSTPGLSAPTLQEVKRYVAMHLWMGVCKFPNIKAHWSGKIMYKSNFPHIMNNQKWLLIDKIFHVNDSNASTTQDTYSKIRPFLTLFQAKFLELAKVSELSSLGIAELNSGDIDFHILCNPLNGYCYYFTPFPTSSSGSTKTLEKNSVSKPGSVLKPTQEEIPKSAKATTEKIEEKKPSLSKEPSAAQPDFSEPAPKKLSRKMKLVDEEEENDYVATQPIDTPEENELMMKKLQMWESAQKDRTKKMMDEDGLEDNSSEVYIEMPTEFDYYIGPLRSYDPKSLQRLPQVSKKMMLEALAKKGLVEPPKEDQAKPIAKKKYESESDSSISSSSDSEEERKKKKKHKKEKKEKHKHKKDRQNPEDYVFEFDKEENSRKDRRSFQTLAKPNRDEAPYQINLGILDESREDTFRSQIEEEMDLLKRKYFKDRDNDSEPEQALSQIISRKNNEKSLEDRLKTKSHDSTKKRTREEMEINARKNFLLEEAYKKKIEKLRNDRNNNVSDSSDSDKPLGEKDIKRIRPAAEKSKEEPENRLLGKYLSKSDEKDEKAEKAEKKLLKLQSQSVSKDANSAPVLKMQPAKTISFEEKQTFKSEDDEKADVGIINILQNKFEGQKLKFYIKNIPFNMNLINTLHSKGMKVCLPINLDKITDLTPEQKSKAGEAFYNSKKHNAILYIGNSLDSPDPLISTIHSEHSILVDDKEKMPVILKEYQLYVDGLVKCNEAVQKFKHPHKVNKPWKHMFFYMLRLAINNANIYFNEMSGNSMAPYDFYESIVNELIGEVEIPIDSIKGASSSSGPVEQHFADFISDGKKLMKCRQVGCNNMTTLGCSKCGSKNEPMPLCLPDCFKKFHSHGSTEK